MISALISNLRSPAAFYGSEAERYCNSWFALGLAVGFLQSKWVLTIDHRIDLPRSTSPDMEDSAVHLPRVHHMQGKEKQHNLYKDDANAQLL